MATAGIVRAYRAAWTRRQWSRDAAAIEARRAERLARALPFPGAFHAPLAMRNFLPYGRELLDEGLEAEAIVALERASQANPSASVLYRLGTLLTKTGQVPRARAAYEAALALDPSLAEAHNDLGTLLAQDGDLDGAIARFRQALAATPEYPDALNNLGYALLLTGRERSAGRCTSARSRFSPISPKRSTTSGCCSDAAATSTVPSAISARRSRARPDFGDAANNLALVLVARGRSDEAVTLLEDL